MYLEMVQVRSVPPPSPQRVWSPTPPPVGVVGVVGGLRFGYSKKIIKNSKEIKHNSMEIKGNPIKGIQRKSIGMHRNSLSVLTIFV